MRLFNSSAVDSIMTRLKLPEDMPIEAKMVSRAVQRAQTQVESRNFEIRKNVLKYDDVMNRQREVVYAERNAVLQGEDREVEQLAESFVEDVVRERVRMFAGEGFAEDWPLDELWTDLEQLYPVGLDRGSLDLQTLVADELADALVGDAMDRYEERETALGSDVMRQVERRVVLSVVDRAWREHLYEMDHLRDGIGLRAVGQRDPLVEYQREAYDAFSAMMSRIKEEAVGYFYNLPVQTEQERQAAQQEAAAREAAQQRQKSAGRVARPPLQRERVQPTTRVGPAGPAAAPGQAPPERAGDPAPVAGGGVAAPGVGVGAPGASARRRIGEAAGGEESVVGVQEARSDKVGRNEPCPCGSGKKYKRCCGA